MRSSVLLCSVLATTVYSQLIIKYRALFHAGEVAENATTLQYLTAMATDLGVLSGVGAVGIAGLCWILVIEQLDVGYAYPFMALSFVLVPISSTILFGESLPPLQLAGLGLIVAGVTISALAR